MAKKKVLFVIWSFSYGGGAEKVLRNIVNNLDSSKYEIEILEYKRAFKPEKVNSNVKINPPILDLTNNSILNVFKRTVIDKVLIKICPKLIRKIFLNKTYDIEIAFNYLIPLFLLNEKSRTLVSWIHSSIEDLNSKRFFREKQRKVLGKVSRIVTISDHTKDSILEIYPEYESKIIKIYNGYAFNNMISDETIEPFQLLYCNRLDDNKNPILFIEIVNDIISKGYDLKVKILGTGELQSFVKAKVNALGLEKNVEIIGYIDNPYPYFEACKIFCLTSFIEGFPTTLVESMFYGKPFVTTNVAGTKELSANNLCGIVANNKKQFVEGVITLLDDDNLYNNMSMNCRTHVVQYSLENQINNIETLLSSL